MMKRHIISEVVTMKPMTYKDLTKEYENVTVLSSDPKDDDNGCLVCHINSLKFEWMPEKAFRGVPFDDFTEVMKFYASVIEEMSSFLKEYTKKKKPSEAQRSIIYTINKHIKALQGSFNKLIQ